ncbi:Transposon Ty3-G Gag-Pol polyprotein [Labeo rohita]|uniref:ribonuclease H n=1 Tax=Labeo rohita TaxID=84645 RepID=A0ABQ8L3G8_LABRO|nr:Transposon Ty3-G Gag-Pol polyprotein [Labeo rohita]
MGVESIPHLVNMEQTTALNVSTLSTAQEQDNTVSRALFYVQQQRRPDNERSSESPLVIRLLKHWNKLTIRDGMLFRVKRDNHVNNKLHQFIVPDALKQEVLHGLHDAAGHQGHSRTLSLARQRFFWAGMERNISNYVRNSEQGDISVDVLVATDHFTKLAYAFPCKNQSAKQELELRHQMLGERLQREHALNHMCNQSNREARRHGRVTSRTRKLKSTCAGTGTQLHSFSEALSGIHTACAWFAWERTTQSRLSRGPTARIASCLACVLSAPGRLSLRREPSSAFLAGLAPQLHSWGSQLDLLEGMETGEPLSPSSPGRSGARSQGSEARSAVPSTQGTASTLPISSSEEVESESVEVAPHSPQYEELLEVVTRAVAKLNIDWPAEKQAEPQRSKLDECFLRNRPPPSHRSLPFRGVLHRDTEVSRSWGKPYSARLFVPASDYYGNVVGTTERGYRAIPRVEQTLASYLSPEVSSSLKAPVLPTKPLRTTSVLVGKGYSAAGQAGSCLHTMAVLQAYQADLLKELDDSDEISKDNISELRRAADLSFRATKETARAIGRSMAAMVAAERHLWLTLSDMKEKDRVFLLDTPLAPSGLFGDAVNSVVDRYQEARKQAAAFQRFLPHRVLALGAAGREQPQPSTSSSHRVSQKQSVASRAPPQQDRDQRRSKPGTSKPRPNLRVVLQAKKTAEGSPCWGGAGSTAFHGVRLSSVPSGDHFIVPKKVGGLRPVLDLRQLNRSVMRLKFKILTVSQVVSQIRSEHWFVTIDLKDAYFHVSILPQHRKFRRFAFRGEAYQYRVLPFSLALSPRTFTKCVDAALAPLRLRGIRILSYIDDWLIMAQSEHMAVQHRDVVLAHMKELGLRLNAKKSVLSPLQRTTYLGVVWDSTTMQARLSPARIESILTTVKRVKEGRSLTVKQFQRLLGLMAAASNVIPFGLLYMRPLQWWLRTKGFSPRGNPFRMIKVTRRALRALDMWKKPWFLSQGPVLGAPGRRVTLATDASLTGWGAVMSGHPARSLWSGRHLTWHINCLEMLAVFRALKHFLPDLIGHHVLVRTDNIAVVYYINHQGGLRSRPLYKLAHQILVWSQDKLLSLKAVYIPGHLNMGADILSRQGPRPGEWMLHPEVVKQIWRVFGQAQVDLFATQENAQCPLWFSLIHPAPLGLDAMVQTWPRLRLSSGEGAPGRGPSSISSPVLAGPSMVLGPDISPRRLSMGDSRQEGSPLASGRHHLSPSPGVVEVMGVAPEGARLVASGLSTEVVETILQSRAPSTRKLYALKWKLFTSWFGDRQQDPVNCPVDRVLEFLQDQFSTGLAHSTLKVYVAAIAAYHAPLGGTLVGKDPLVVHFLHGALRLRPPVRPRVPTWDLAVVLEALCGPPFEPIEESSDHLLSIKTVLLLALSSLKRVGDLQALSVAPSHLDFAPGMAKVFLYPRPGYVPKVPSVPPRPVFEHWTHTFTDLPCGENLNNCSSVTAPPKKGLPASKQTLSRWIVDAITLSYESSGLPSPLGVKAHSTRGISASKAFLSGVPMQDICNAAGWSSPLTFVRFYDLDLRVAPGSSVLLS